MTLQERMIAVYLRTAKLPEMEKEKLRLFLGLLLEAMEPDDAEEAAPPPGPILTGPKVEGPPPPDEFPGERDGGAPVPFAEKLIRAIDRRGLSQRAAAREIGVSDATVGKIVRGIRCGPKAVLAVSRWIDAQAAPGASTASGAAEKT